MLTGTIAAHIKFFGGRAPLFRVVIGRCQPGKDKHALRDGRALEFDVVEGDPTRELHRADESQHLVDRCCIEFRVGPPDCGLLRMTEQFIDAGANEVHGGFVAGDEQQVDLVAQLARRQTVTAFFSSDQCSEQVVAWVFALPANDLVDVCIHRVGCGPDLGERIEGQHWIE